MIDVNELKKGNRICVFIRHGEKDINNYCLTDAGKCDIIEFGRLICLLKTQVIIYSSPEIRCIETANIINNIVNGIKCDIHVSDVLGKPGIQVKDEVEYTKLTDSIVI